MQRGKYHIAFDDYEKRLLILCLNRLRTKQLEAGKDSIPVDEVLLKIIKAKKRKFKNHRKRGLIMEQTIFEQSGGKYVMQGDYLLPNLTLPTEEEKPIGVWGQRRRRYLKEYHKVLYYNLLTSGKLNTLLAYIEEQAESLFSRLVKEFTEKEAVTEQLKATNSMAWVQKMNNIGNMPVR